MENAKVSKVSVWMRKNVTLLVTLAGVTLGITEGFILRPMQLSGDTVSLIAYPGDLFMRFLKMMMLPLIFSSLITATSNLDPKISGKIAMRTLVLFFATNVISILYGLSLALLLRPGDRSSRVDPNNASSISRSTGIRDNLMDLGRNFVPENLFQALFQHIYTAYATVDKITNSTADNGTFIHNESEIVRELRYRYGTNTVGLVFFCLTFGIYLSSMGPKGKVIFNIFDVLFEVSLKMIITIMTYIAPIGISSLIAGKILSVVDLGVLVSQLTHLVMTVSIGIFTYQLIGLQLIYFLFMRKNPYKFYWPLLQPVVTVFATSSTPATLPLTLRVMENTLGVDSRITRFILPIGATMNTDGTALFMIVATMFITQLNGISLSFGELIIMVVLTTLLSMSGPPVPGGSLILIYNILQSLDVPTDDISILFTVDWFLNRIRVTNNMLSDCYTAVIVEKFSKKELRELDKLTEAEGNNPISDSK